MNSVIVELRPETAQKLREKAAKHGQSLEAYVQGLAENDALTQNGQHFKSDSVTPSLDELLIPVQTAFAESGMNDQELADLVEEVREEIWQEKKAGKP